MTPASYVVDVAGGVRWAFGASVREGASVDEAADHLVTTLPGHRVETDDDRLVTALLARGGTVQRRAHDYEYALTDVPASFAEPALPDGVALAPVGEAAALAPAHERALPPGHPDHEPGLDHVADLEAMLAGRVVGRFVPESSWQVEVAGQPVGAVIVVDRPAFGPTSARLWVVDIFVHPREQGRGLGSALLQRSLARSAAAGRELMGLAVSEGNPARRTYERLGFRLVSSGTNVDLPG